MGVKQGEEKTKTVYLIALILFLCGVLAAMVFVIKRIAENLRDWFNSLFSH